MRTPKPFLSVLAILVTGLPPLSLHAQQCSLFVDVENLTGTDVSGVSLYFAGFSPGGITSILVEPDEFPCAVGEASEATYSTN
jgi:hypothetical protein